MAYIGQKPFQEFTSIPTKDSFTGDGSTTTFDLANDVVRGAEFALEVFIDNVRQEPGSGKAFTLGIDGSNNYRRITFTAAPANGASIYVINDKTNLTTIAPVQTDFNGVEIVLDADSDTTLHAETDDQVDLRIAGNDVLKFLQSSGDAVLKPMVDAKDIIFQQFDGNKIFEINDGNFVGVGGNATAPGEIRIYEDTDNGSNYSGFKAAASTTSSVAYQLPAADGSSGESLTTNGSGVLSWSAGVTIANDTNNRIVTADGSSGLNGEANLTFDGTTLALTGNSTVSGTLGVSGVTTSNAGVVVDNITIDGTTIALSSGDLLIDVANDLILDADGNNIILQNGGTEYGRLSDSAGSLLIKSTASDKDMIFRGNDGGANVDALTFDMSNAGSAVFNGSITANAGVAIDNIFIDGTEIDLSSGDLTIDVAGDIVLDADGGDVVLKDGGTQFGGFSNSSGNLIIKDGTTTAATFSGANVTFAGTVDSGAITSTGIVTAVGTSVFTNLDISGDVDVDGTTNLDVVDIDGAVDMASTLTLGGTLTVNAGAVFNEGSADVDFRVESNGQANMLFVDGGNNRVHINGTTGTREFNVSGDNTRLLLYSTNNSTGAGQLQFGDADNEQIGRIMYEHDGNNMTFHTSATERMKIHGDGEINMPGQPCFSATAGQNNISLSTQTTVSLGSERFDVGSNLASNAFTAPVTGKYLLTYMFYFTQMDADHTTLDVHITTSNKQYQQTFSPDHFLNSDSNFSVSGSVIADMDANDTAEYRVYMVGGAAQTDIHSDSQVSGCLLA